MKRFPTGRPTCVPGCPHRGVFLALNGLKAFVAGDIGCYTLGFMPPLSAMDTCICMGASIGNAAGLEQSSYSRERGRRWSAVIGDSTFLHTGVNGLMDMVYNRSTATVIILDNRITGHDRAPGESLLGLYPLRGGKLRNRPGGSVPGGRGPPRRGDGPLRARPDAGGHPPGDGSARKSRSSSPAAPAC